LAPQVFRRGHAAQDVSLLLRVAELEHGWREQEDAVLGDPLRASRPVVLLLEDQPLPPARTPASVLLGPRNRRVATLEQGPFPVEVLRETLGGVARQHPIVVTGPPRRELVFQPAPSL